MLRHILISHFHWPPCIVHKNIGIYKAIPLHYAVPEDVLQQEARLIFIVIIPSSEINENVKWPFLCLPWGAGSAGLFQCLCKELEVSGWMVFF